MIREWEDRIEESNQPATEPEEKPFYERANFRPDPKAIAAFDALPRPKCPPRRMVTE